MATRPTRTTRARVARAPRPARKVAPDFYGPDESPEGEVIAQEVGQRITPKKRPRRATRTTVRVRNAPGGHPGRPLVPRMPLLDKQGVAYRPRAKGSRAVQPPVEFGPITSQLKLASAVGTLPYSSITSSMGSLIREYRQLIERANLIWQQFERLEIALRDLVKEGEDLDGAEA